MVKVVTHFSWMISDDQYSEATINRCVKVAEESEGWLKVRPSTRSYNDTKEYWFSGDIPTDEPVHNRVLAVIRELGLDASRYQTATFTRAEVDAAELLNCYPTNYVTHTEAERSGTVYETIITCDRCKLTRREQRSQLRLRNANLQGRKMSKTYGDDTYVLSPELAHLFRGWGVTGCELAPVRDSGTGQESPLVQLVPTWRLPDDLAPSTVWSVNEDALCWKCGHFGKVPLYLHYDRAALGPIHDVGLAPTFYSMNHFTGPYLLISRRLYHLFRENKVKGYRVEPVLIV